MRMIRWLIAALLTMSLAVSPIAAGAAKSMSHMTQSQTNIATTAEKCPCCNTMHQCNPETCQLACHSLPGIAVEGPQPPNMGPEGLPLVRSVKLRSSAPRPEPPPPRS